MLMIGSIALEDMHGDLIWEALSPKPGTLAVLCDISRGIPVSWKLANTHIHSEGWQYHKV